VAPNNVSGRVVKTETSVSSSAIANSISAPSLRPIQLRCIALMRSGHSIVSRASISSSAYAVVLKNHCSRFLDTTSAPQYSQWPSCTCSFASTTWSTGHHVTGEPWR
jgi:hypothetical protein